MKHALRSILLGLLLPAMAAALGAAARPKAPKEPVNLNTATATELMQLPRVGPRMALRILDYRKANGPFRRPEDLLNIKGIGEKGFLRLVPFVTLDSRAPERPPTGPARPAPGDPAAPAPAQIPGAR